MTANVDIDTGRERYFSDVIGSLFTRGEAKGTERWAYPVPKLPRDNVSDPISSTFMFAVVSVSDALDVLT
jgi:hypothetical protein